MTHSCNQDALMQTPLLIGAHSRVSHDFCRAGAFLQRHYPTLARRATESRFDTRQHPTRQPHKHQTRRISFFTQPIARDHGSTTKRQCRADTCPTGRNRTNDSTRENQHHHRNTRTRRRNQHARAEELQTPAAARQYAGDGAQAKIQRAGFSHKRATTAG